MSESVPVHIIVVSDRCSRGSAVDLTGPALREAAASLGWRVAGVEVVPDSVRVISRRLRALSPAGRAMVILTAGGTGLSPRDVTPEATRSVVGREVPGIVELMRLRGLAKTPRAALSRAVAGTRHRAVIVNLPGSPRGAVESFRAVAGILPHALSMLAGEGHPRAEKRRR